MTGKIYLLLAAAFFAANLPAQVVINEYSAANWKQFIDNHSDYEDWVELYNTSSEAVNLGGYYLSDNEDKPDKWQFRAGTTIAANGFLRVWCSSRDTVQGTHFHSNFKLTQTKNNPETLVLARPNKVVMDKVVVEKTAKHQSRARLTDGATAWRVCTTPTPNASNDAANMFTGFADRPSMSAEAGFFTDSVTVAIETDEPGGVIRYTLDGTEPTATSPQYTGPLTLKKTTVVKARTFSPDPQVLPSFVQFNTYFINVSHTLVVVSIGADELLDLANGDQDLRPEGTFEYFGKDLLRKTRSYGELNSHGQDSWANDQRSLDWISRDEFGYSEALKEKIFPTSDRDEFQRIILRASGDDNYPAAHNPQNRGSAHMRDDYVQSLAKSANMSLDLRTAERCIVYLNGEYWGVYSFREKVDDHDYTQFYYNQDKYDLQWVMTWGNTWSEYGGQQSINDWKLLRSWILTRNMADSANYKYVTDRLDVQSLVDYFIVNQASVCSDWLNYNTGWWRGMNPEGTHHKWGYILWDNDATFGFYINYTGVPDTTPTAKPCDINDFDTNWGNPDPEKHIQILNKLQQNPGFKQFYLSRQADMFNTVYSCENMLHVLDSMAAIIEPEMAQHAVRWFGTYSEWQKNLGRLRHFIERRCQLYDEGMVDCFDLTGPYPVVFQVEPPGAGAIKVNTLAPNPNTWQGQYYGGMQNLLSVVPATNTGLVFDRWESRTGASTFSLDSALPDVAATVTAPDTIVALFRLATATHEASGNVSGLSVFPTVFDNQLNVNYKLAEKADVQVRVISTLGRELARFSLGQQVGEQSVPLNLSHLNLHAGTYFVQVQAGADSRTERVVKVRQ